MHQRLVGCVLFVLGAAGCTDFVGSNSDSTSTGTVESTGSTGTSETNTPTSAGSETSTAGPTTTTSGTTTVDSTTGSTGTETSGDTSSTGEPPPSCDNGIRDEDETDIDCGGPCEGCDFGQGCAGGTDCDTGFCAVDFTCGLQPPVVWLDASDPSTLFSDDACVESPPTDGQQVYCWRNKGSHGGQFVDQGAQPHYLEADVGLEFGDDLLFSDDEVFGGELDDVTVFVVQREISSRNSFDFNLNHPAETNSARYSTHIPWGSSRRVVFDIGGTNTERIRTPAGVIEVGETHLFAFVNSAEESARMIRIDGTEHASGDGNLSATASTVSIGSGAHIMVHEFRVYSPSPSPTHRTLIEGQLACSWGMRDQLPAEHPFHADDGGDPSGCPPALE